MIWFRIVFVVGLILQPFMADAGTRAIWVTRWDFQSAGDIKKIMENAKYIGADTVLFQVRGSATVYYPSNIEPWDWGIGGTGFETLGVDPGWDPLRTAIDAAHERGLELHAWMNIFPGWRGLKSVPTQVNQLWRTKREWFMIDHLGKLLRPSDSFYTFLSPGIKDVQNHLGSLFGEIARKYKDLDGVHMDYVRYPAHTEIGGFRDFSYDPETKANYKKQYNKFPKHDDPDWQIFKTRQIANAVKIMRDAAKKENPNIQVSATFVAETEKALTQTGQNINIWMGEKLVDWAVPMAYKRTVNEYQAVLLDLEKHCKPEWKVKMIPGINAAFSKFPVSTLNAQIKYNQDHGYGGSALFAYDALFPRTTHQPNQKTASVKKLWHEDRLQEVLNSK